MSVDSGQYGKISKDVGGTITAITECTNWSISKATPTTRYASCSTGGYSRTVTGVKQISGTIAGMFDRANPIEQILDIGDRILLQLHYNATAGHKFWVRITSGPNYNQDIKEGTAPEWTANWEMDDPAPAFNTTLTAIP